VKKSSEILEALQHDLISPFEALLLSTRDKFWFLIQSDQGQYLTNMDNLKIKVTQTELELAKKHRVNLTPIEEEDFQLIQSI